MRGKDIKVFLSHSTQTNFYEFKKKKKKTYFYIFKQNTSYSVDFE